MSLQAGDKLGPYEILACLGAGGMGEVYTARDTRLDRLVAVKVSKQQFSERFEREARAIASLNHPNICQVYDVGPDFLVIEYLEGETLAARLAKGALPLDQTLGIGMQIADALNTAHRKAIVHRDLKPANIMLTKSGAKLLDFGLARIEQNRPASDETLTMAMTTPGTVLGTFQYMAPEQLEAKETDARTDVFAFGAVLYEMLTGRKAFEGKSQASLIAAILEREPAPATTIQPLTPPALEHALKRCLAKDPDSRWQTARDVKAELEWVVSGTEVQQQSKSPPTLLPWIAAAVATLAFLVVAWLHFLEPQPPIAAVRFTISPPEGTRISPGPPWGSPLAVSPDGRRLVFVAIGKDGIRRLWVRVLDVLAAQVLPGTEDASAPFWSPDSERVGFFAGNRLKRVAVSGGEAQTLCQCQTGGGGGTWSKNNVILFSPALAGESGLLRISASGGTPVQVTMLDAARNRTLVQCLPNHDRILGIIFDKEYFNSAHTVRDGPP
jgi:serine/threonine protein kinase